MKTVKMVWILRGLFGVVLGSMLAVTSWASLHCPLFAIPRDVLHHPWFIATLVDAYWAFLAFFVWVAWKEQGGVARALWLVAIILWGNIAMAVYFLRELAGIETDDQIGLVFTRRNPGHNLLAAVLAVSGVAVYLFAWHS